MAEQLEEWPGLTTRAKYPWNDWLNGKPWLLTKAEDFPNTTIAAFRATVSNKAKERGGKARTQAKGETQLIIQFYTPEPSEG